jgi:hypothetical protein
MTAPHFFPRPVPPDGVLAGTDTRAENEGRSVTYTWRLTPAG